jgi:phage recombination protein Bet
MKMEQSLVIKESLTPEIVRSMLVRGKGNITDREITMFIQLCKAKNLNPFINEAYIIKFGSEDATIVTSKDVFIRRAAENVNCDGWKAGIVVYNKETKTIEEREGTVYIKTTELLAGGWCEVFIKNRDKSIKATVMMEEYVQKKADGSPNKFWATKPATMIRKVAVGQALREAFPTDFNGLYVEEEVQQDEEQPKIIEKQIIDIPEPTSNEKIDPGF